VKVTQKVFTSIERTLGSPAVPASAEGLFLDVKQVLLSCRVASAMRAWTYPRTGAAFPTATWRSPSVARIGERTWSPLEPHGPDRFWQEGASWVVRRWVRGGAVARRGVA
jgi:hypothetical protein